jgi:hypothetical protein
MGGMEPEEWTTSQVRDYLGYKTLAVTRSILTQRWKIRPVAYKASGEALWHADAVRALGRERRQQILGDL